MAGELSVSDFIELVDVCGSRHVGRIDCIGDGKFPGNKGSRGESGEVIANGVNPGQDLGS